MLSTKLNMIFAEANSLGTFALPRLSLPLSLIRSQSLIPVYFAISRMGPVLSPRDSGE